MRFHKVVNTHLFNILSVVWIVCIFAYGPARAQTEPERTCSTGNALWDYLVEPAPGMTPHAIADFFVDEHLLQYLDAPVRTAWPAVRAAEGNLSAAKISVADEHAEALRALWAIHSLIVDLESVRFTPEALAKLNLMALPERDRTNMSQETYRNEFLAAAKRVQQDTGINAHVAALSASIIMRNRLDDLAGVPASVRIDPYDGYYVLLQDMWARKQANKPKVERITGSPVADGYWREYQVARRWLLGCLGSEKRSWHALGKLDGTDFPVAAARVDGKWCAEEVTVRWATEDLELVLDRKRRVHLSQAAADMAMLACEAARQITVEVEVDDGRAGVFASVYDREDGGMRPLGEREQFEAFVERLRAARAGDAEAMGEVGAWYLVGRIVDRAPVAGFQWTKLGAENGDPLSQAELSRLYHEGLGTPQDREAALHWANLSAEAGNPLGLNQRAYLMHPGSDIFSFLRTTFESDSPGELFQSIVQSALDLELAVAQCERKRYADDPRYDGICEQIRETKQKMKAAPPPAQSPECEAGLPTCHNYLFNQADGMQHAGTMIMIGIK